MAKINKLMQYHLSDFDESYKYGLAHIKASYGCYSDGYPNDKNWKGLAKIEFKKERFICSKTEFSIDSYGPLKLVGILSKLFLHIILYENSDIFLYKRYVA